MWIALIAGPAGFFARGRVRAAVIDREFETSVVSADDVRKHSFLLVVEINVGARNRFAAGIVDDAVHGDGFYRRGLRCLCRGSYSGGKCGKHPEREQSDCDHCEH